MPTRRSNPLADWLRQHGVSQEDFAAKIAAHQTQVSRYVTGARKPSRRVRQAISDATGGDVPPKSWDRRGRRSLVPSHA